MKTLRTRFVKPIFFNSLMLFALAVGFTSCSKDDDDNATASANLMVVNAVEGSSSQDFYLDDAKVNTQAIAYQQSNGYFAVNTGDHKADFKTSGSATVNATSNVNFQAGKFYTIYYTGNASTKSNFTVEDDVTAPTAGMVKVRFINLSTAAVSALDFGVTAGAKLVSNVAYKAASAYYTVTPANTFQVFATGSTTAALNIPNLSLQAGKIYTVYVTGSATTNLTYKVIAHN